MCPGRARRGCVLPAGRLSYCAGRSWHRRRGTRPCRFSLPAQRSVPPRHRRSGGSRAGSGRAAASAAGFWAWLF
ncbi:hypothetical protein AF364_21055 [Salmonella enterica subsp. enterica serovar Typhimurium]|nr:hypothetical protein AF364_21055 [Salmonella enterica subsp. enterica serovar Typhimurium]